MEGFQIIGRGRKPFPDAVKLLEDTVFHFGRSLIGESDGQNVAVGMAAFLFDQRLDVLYGQGERLARACRCLVNSQTGFHVVQGFMFW